MQFLCAESTIYFDVPKFPKAVLIFSTYTTGSLLVTNNVIPESANTQKNSSNSKPRKLFHTLILSLHDQLKTD